MQDRTCVVVSHDVFVRRGLQGLMCGEVLPHCRGDYCGALPPPDPDRADALRQKGGGAHGKGGGGERERVGGGAKGGLGVGGGEWERRARRVREGGQDPNQPNPDPREDALV